MTTHDIGPDDGFDRWLAKAAPTLNAPGPTPKGDMWTEIEARVGSASPRPSTLGRRHRPRWLWPLAIAAALVLGAAIDRFMLRKDGAVVPAPQVARTDSTRIDTAVPAQRQLASDPKPQPRPGLERNARPERVASGNTGPSASRRNDSVARQDGAPTSRSVAPEGPSRTLRLAATQTLAQAELVLAAYRAEDFADGRELGRWARDVLSSTRLLLDSKIAQDAVLRSLLQDLELVLMQIAQLSGAALDQTERELLDQTLKERDLIPRIRAAVPAGPGAIRTTTSD